jgi:hypothetical protein
MEVRERPLGPSLKRDDTNEGNRRHSVSHRLFTIGGTVPAAGPLPAKRRRRTLGNCIRCGSLDLTMIDLAERSRPCPSPTRTD